MKVLTCAAAGRRLQAFHDGELSIAEQISVDQHLDWCDPCAAKLAELRALRQVLRAAAREHSIETPEPGFQAGIVARAKAEERVSIAARTRELLEDMHLMYAAAGATAASFVCIAIVLGMIRFATTERPDSLAAMLNWLGSPGTNENPVVIDPTVHLPRALDEAFSTNPVGDDAFYTLAAVVTREGRVENLALLHALGSATVDLKGVEDLLDSVSRARFQPARVSGLPVAVNMVWLVAHTTVRGSNKVLDQPTIRAGRKRTAGVQTNPAAAV